MLFGRTLETDSDAARRGSSAFFAFLSALLLTLSQTLTLAHASSHEAQAPAHDATTCIFHVAGDRPAAALAPDALDIAAPFRLDVAIVELRAAAMSASSAAAAWARGPPLEG